MNPLGWKREHQIALAVAALIGMIVGPVVGYIAYAAGAGAGGAVDFSYWIWTCAAFSGRDSCAFSSFSSIWWSFAGAIVATGIVYVRRLTSS